MATCVTEIKTVSEKLQEVLLEGPCHITMQEKAHKGIQICQQN